MSFVRNREPGAAENAGVVTPPIILRAPPLGLGPQPKGTYCLETGSYSVTMGTNFGKSATLQFMPGGGVIYKGVTSFSSRLGGAGATVVERGSYLVIPGRPSPLLLITLGKRGALLARLPAGGKGLVRAFTVNGDRYSKDLCRY